MVYYFRLPSGAAGSLTLLAQLAQPRADGVLPATDHTGAHKPHVAARAACRARKVVSYINVKPYRAREVDYFLKVVIY